MKSKNGSSSKRIAKRPSGPQHVLASPTKQGKAVPTWSASGRKSMSGGDC